MSEYLTFDQYEYRLEILRYLRNRSLQPDEIHRALLHIPEDMFLSDPKAQVMTHFILVNAFEPRKYEKYLMNKLKNPVAPLHIGSLEYSSYSNSTTFLLGNNEYIYTFKPSYLPLTEQETERVRQLKISDTYQQYAKPLQRIPILGGFLQQYDDQQTAWIMQDEHAFPARWESMKMQYTHLKHSLSTFLDNPTG